MKWITIALFFIFAKLTASDSVSISFLVIDSVTKKPIEGVHISDYKQNIFTNSTGEAKIIWKASTSSIRYIFYKLGYYRKEITLLETEIRNQPIVILLVPRNYHPKKCKGRKKIDYVGE